MARLRGVIAGERGRQRCREVVRGITVFHVELAWVCCPGSCQVRHSVCAHVPRGQPGEAGAVLADEGFRSVWVKGDREGVRISIGCVGAFGVKNCSDRWNSGGE